MTTTILDPKTKEMEINSSALSMRSNSTLSTLIESPSSFYPSRILTINAQGIRAFRLPLPSRQTEIFIYNPDGTEAYVSTRDKLCSGNAILSHPERGSLIRTEYFFGPGRDPVVHLLQPSSDIPEELSVTGKWTSRTMCFRMPDGKQFEWEYAKEKRADGQKVNLIVFRAAEEEKGKGKETRGHRIAQLVRGEDSRTPGTSRSSAGNGGELQIDEAALQSLELDEAVIVATCLMMLKKEIDRRRLIQFALIGGAGGS
ncbi:MAG: hypothetical protein LBE64_08985 [Acinetobacter pittii]|jgi:hypothetical protein|uniref:Uncharacterized protein n=1 Tax=Penicillium chrysogenum TaxID=5076 RepID=A0ABQ8W8S6_PENCH|nr:hypothetical protein N7524_010773 [Penicillium chrysogenum]KAJ5260328.1 hypothetical protein N7505_009709 [Penicillium chrysogenum]KAJ6141742.1 hypothetical protein N7497_010841 [Penicillium chrysogenum]MBZ6431218.1 hypothetical protein [Acinetobacter pittii]